MIFFERSQDPSFFPGAKQRVFCVLMFDACRSIWIFHSCSTEATRSNIPEAFLNNYFVCVSGIYSMHLQHVEGFLGHAKSESTLELCFRWYWQAPKRTSEWGAINARNAFRRCTSSRCKRTQERQSSLAASVGARVKNSYGSACLQHENTKILDHLHSLREYHFLEGFGLSENIGEATKKPQFWRKNRSWGFLREAQNNKPLVYI